MISCGFSTAAAGATFVILAGGVGLGGVGLGGLGLGGATLGEIGLKMSEVSREASWNGSDSCKGEFAKGSSMLEKSIFLVTGFGERSPTSELGEKMSNFSLEA